MAPKFGGPAEEYRLGAHESRGSPGGVTDAEAESRAGKRVLRFSQLELHETQSHGR